MIMKYSRTFVASSTENPCNIRSEAEACYWQNTQNHKWYVFHICRTNKLALLWGEAQKKIAYSYLKVT